MNDDDEPKDILGRPGPCVDAGWVNDDTKWPDLDMEVDKLDPHAKIECLDDEEWVKHMQNCE